MKHVEKRLLHAALHTNYVSNTYLAIFSVIISCIVVLGNYHPAAGAQGSTTVDKGNTYVTLTPEAPAGTGPGSSYDSGSQGTGTLASSDLNNGAIVVAAQQTTYDAASDSIGFDVHLLRIDGYSKPITSISAFNTTSGATFNCQAQTITDETYTLTCAFVSGTRQSSGTMLVNISTARDTFYTYAGFSLPPR